MSNLEFLFMKDFQRFDLGKSLEDLAYKCYQVTRTEKSEQEKVGISLGSWVDALYKFEKISLSTSLMLWCDGGYSLLVNFNGKEVLSYEGDMEEISGHITNSCSTYIPGNWELDINNLFQKIPTENII